MLGLHDGTRSVASEEEEPMAIVRKIDHCAIYVHDVERSASFYERLLETPAAYQGDTGMGVPGAFFIYGDTILALLLVPEEETLGRQHVAFAVDSADATYQKLLAKGFETEGAPSDLPVGFIKGQRSFEIRDPDEALIEFVERPAVEPFSMWGAGNSALVGGA
jgi:catechol 2,3-dioxygenase-like lactoylglutathione lyase family enzyme